MCPLKDSGQERPQKMFTHYVFDNFLDNFIAQSKNSTHLKLRKLPESFCSLNMCDFPCIASFEACGGTTFTDTAEAALGFPLKHRGCLGFPSTTHTCGADPCPQFFCFVFCCPAFQFFRFLCQDVTVRNQKHAHASQKLIFIFSQDIGAIRLAPCCGPSNDMRS